MSVCSWVVILWKGWLLQRAVRDVGRSTAAFWQAPDWAQAQTAVRAFDRESLVIPLVEATQQTLPGTLGASGDRSQQLTRVLRDALHGVLRQLQAGQVLAGDRRVYGALCGSVGHGLGHLPCADGHCRFGSSQHRQDFRPGGRGA